MYKISMKKTKEKVKLLKISSKASRNTNEILRIRICSRIVLFVHKGIWKLLGAVSES